MAIAFPMSWAGALFAVWVQKPKEMSMARSRQAVILIHGVGEQRPMETLRSFVDSTLDSPPHQATPPTQQKRAGTMPKFYSRPDFLADNLELRRLVSSGSKVDRRTFT